MPLITFRFMRHRRHKETVATIIETLASLDDTVDAPRNRSITFRVVNGVALQIEVTTAYGRDDGKPGRNSTANFVLADVAALSGAQKTALKNALIAIYDHGATVAG